MNTDRHQIMIRGIPVDIVRKDIKNLHVGVYPPGGRVRVAAPGHMDNEAIRVAVVSRLGWIKRQRSRFASQERQSQREMITGESHYFQGRRYRLAVIQTPGRASVRVANNSTMELRVRPDMEPDKRLAVLERWYRRQLKEQLPGLVAKWEPVIGVTVGQWRIRKMKTRWGSCNAQARRIWLNLELAKKPPGCLEYILVHEMVHLLERQHSERFAKLMDRFMPDWRLRKDELNQAPLGHEEWGY
ncbi:M48 family metallopeptidase [Desulfovermiculus halophilus]|uniref:M48 family metallopeptidase n=1 Tax=Desulfovermiculus halophilus TaxID=339722 RepID=UPI0004821E4F|nr:SprT family zinc-dependent metalloprotease [Desulfovermiculus halophilus]